MSELARAFGLSAASWERARNADLRGPALTAVGAWVLMAWNRFGLQGLAAPRVGVRFVLIGFYAWIAMAGLIWLGGRLAAQRSTSTPASALASTHAPISTPVATSTPAATSSSVPAPGLLRLVVVTGWVHKPLVVVGVALQLLAFVAPGSGVGTVVAALALLLWMPAMLVAALAWAFDRPMRQLVVVVGVTQAVWLATAGRFLLTQVGHLL